MRLVTSGCSYTCGWPAKELSHEEYVSGSEKYWSWPYWVAKKLNIEQISFAQGGWNNVEICESIIFNRDLLELDDYIIVQLSYFNRMPKYIKNIDKDNINLFFYILSLKSVINLIDFLELNNFKYLILNSLDTFNLKIKDNECYYKEYHNYQPENFKNNKFFQFEELLFSNDIDNTLFLSNKEWHIKQNKYIRLVESVINNSKYISNDIHLPYLKEKGIELENDNTYFFNKIKGKVNNHCNERGAKLWAHKVIELMKI